MYRAIQLYRFLEYCLDEPLKKEILECGAGIVEGYEPLLVRFFDNGFTTHGVDNNQQRVDNAHKYCKDTGKTLDIQLGDMRSLEFENDSMSFVYSYNAIFHMEKTDIQNSINEIWRVLKPGGLCFVNLLSVDDGEYGKGVEVSDGAFSSVHGNHTAIHCYYEDDQADKCFEAFKLVMREKRILDMDYGKGLMRQAFIDYILQKPKPEN